MSPDPPDLDSISHGWERDEVNRLLSPTGIPAGVPPTPLEVLKLVKCTYSSVAASVSCTVMYCREATKLVSDLPE